MKAHISEAFFGPARNSKKGAVSGLVNVQPCHSACSSGAYTALQLPGLLTSIIEAMVAPRNTSSDMSRPTAAGAADWGAGGSLMRGG